MTCPQDEGVPAIAWRKEKREDLRGIIARDGGPAQQTVERPTSRLECGPGGKFWALRPCPFVGCRHNLRVEVVRGHLRVADEDWPEEVPSCTLDAAAEGPRTLEEVGDLIGLTRERIRQEEARAVESLKAALPERFWDVDVVRLLSRGRPT